MPIGNSGFRWLRLKGLVPDGAFGEVGERQMSPRRIYVGRFMPKAMMESMRDNY